MKVILKVGLFINALVCSVDAFPQNAEFSFNGSADVIMRYPPRGSGGRAIVHAPDNVLALNFGGDFTGGTMLGTEVYFKDGGNSFINSGNFGIGTSLPTGIFELKKLNSNLVFDLGTNGLSKIISKGWNANIDIHTFQINGQENLNQLHLNSNGNVGIGTDSPEAPLTVYGNSVFFPRRVGDGDARSLWVDYRENNAQFISNDYPVILRTGGGNQPLILDAARIGIGTTNPGEKLSVNGNIRGKEIKIEAANWPDYVFEDTYKISSLTDVERYIKINKHLPDMPSAQAIQENGLGVSKMLKLQQQKIEELTLHLIEQDKQIGRLLKVVNELLECTKND